MTAWLCRCAPGVCFCYWCGGLLLVFLAPHPLFALASFAGIVLHAVSLTGWSRVFAARRASWAFCGLVALVNPLINRRGSHIIGYLFERQVTGESVAYGGYMFLLLSSLLLVFHGMDASMGSGRILHLFSRSFPQTGFLLGMSLRFSMLLGGQARDYLAAQTTRRCWNGDEGGRLRRITRYGGLLGGFSAYALENGLRTAEFLRARGYGARRRSLYGSYVFAAADGLFAAGCLLLAGCAGWLRLAGAGRFDYYKQLEQAFALRSADWGALCAVIGYWLLPFLPDAAAFARHTARRGSTWT